MAARLRTLRALALPQGYLDLLRQIALIGLAYGAYSLVRGLVEGKATDAFQHARDLIQGEVDRALAGAVRDATGDHDAVGVDERIRLLQRGRTRGFAVVRHRG